MKRPKHMTMKELIELPVVRDRGKLNARPESDEKSQTYGGVFRDECGYVWGTLKMALGWVRFPAHLPLLN